MAKVGTKLNVISETPNKEKIEKIIDYANPNATDENLSMFVTHFEGLSQNRLKGVQKIRTDDLILPPSEDD